MAPYPNCLCLQGPFAINLIKLVRRDSATIARHVLACVAYAPFIAPPPASAGASSGSAGAASSDAAKVVTAAPVVFRQRG